MAKKFPNKHKFILGLTFVFVLLTTPLWAKGQAGVSNTIHNLSTTNLAGVYASNTDEVCVFCHTPHGGNLNGPLWNRNLPGAGSFTHYNSATLTLTSLAGMTASRTVNDESLLCMSCHDGSIALDHLLNDPNSLGGADIYFPLFGANDMEIIDLNPNPGPRIGGSPGNSSGSGDLTDDHPISFSYQAVQSQAIYQGGARDGELRDIGTTSDPTTALGWKGEGVRFFGSDYRVECSSCHDPHVDYVSGVNNPKNYKPFLIRPNSGSDLCLACHNK